jgi:hypothetical protein
MVSKRGVPVAPCCGGHARRSASRATDSVCRMSCNLRVRNLQVRQALGQRKLAGRGGGWVCGSRGLI